MPVAHDMEHHLRLETQNDSNMASLPSPDTVDPPQHSLEQQQQPLLALLAHGPADVLARVVDQATPPGNGSADDWADVVCALRLSSQSLSSAARSLVVSLDVAALPCAAGGVAGACSPSTVKLAVQLRAYPALQQLDLTKSESTDDAVVARVAAECKVLRRLAVNGKSLGHTGGRGAFLVGTAPPLAGHRPFPKQRGDGRGGTCLCLAG